MKTARVIEEHKTNYTLSSEGEEIVATVRGSFFTEEDFPKVGDFVEYTLVSENTAVIENICERTSSIVRKSSHTGKPQVIVANVDTIFIVVGLDNDFNLSRIERYLLLAKQSNVEAVIVLNKSDVVDDVSTYIEKTTNIAGDVPVFAVSAETHTNMEELLEYLKPETTVVLLGSSGAGKSTITNWLLNEDVQKIKDVREDDSRGRHTTTSRQLFTLPTGAHLIDTPGMRELGLLDTTTDDEGVIFSEIEKLTSECQFTKCDHEKSKGCAIQKAIEEGTVTERQLQSYKKIQRERLFEESKHDEELSYKQKQRQKKLHKGYKKILEQKRFEEDL